MWAGIYAMGTHPRALMISPDGSDVYVSAHNSDSIISFSRNAATGELTFERVVDNGLGGVRGLDLAYAVAASPDGVHLYAGGNDATLAVFARDAASGDLTFVGAVRNDVDGVEGLYGVRSLSFSPDGDFLTPPGCTTMP